MKPWCFKIKCSTFKKKCIEYYCESKPDPLCFHIIVDVDAVGMHEANKPQGVCLFASCILRLVWPCMLTLVAAICYIYENVLQTLVMCIGGENPVLVNPKWPHYFTFFFFHQPFYKSVSSRCGTLGGTSLRTTTSPSRCRLSPIQVPPCERGSVRFTPYRTTAFLCEIYTPVCYAWQVKFA